MPAWEENLLLHEASIVGMLITNCKHISDQIFVPFMALLVRNKELTKLSLTLPRSLTLYIYEKFSPFLFVRPFVSNTCYSVLILHELQDIFSLKRASHIPSLHLRSFSEKKFFSVLREEKEKEEIIRNFSRRTHMKSEADSFYF